MAAAGSLTTPRQQRTVYLHTRDNSDLDFTRPDYIFNAEEDMDSDSELVGIPQATLNSYNNANFKTIDVDPGAGVHNRVLTYNPITDEYGISEGEYVL